MDLSGMWEISHLPLRVLQGKTFDSLCGGWGVDIGGGVGDVYDCERKNILHYVNIHGPLSPSPALSFIMVPQFCFLLHYNLFLLHYNLFFSLVSQVPSLENFLASLSDSAWVLQSRDGTEILCRGRDPLVTLDIQVFIQLQKKHFHYINILWASDVDLAGKRSIVFFVRRERTYQKIPRYSSSDPSSIHE